MPSHIVNSLLFEFSPDQHRKAQAVAHKIHLGGKALDLREQIGDDAILFVHHTEGTGQHAGQTQHQQPQGDKGDIAFGIDALLRSGILGNQQLIGKELSGLLQANNGIQAEAAGEQRDDIKQHRVIIHDMSFLFLFLSMTELTQKQNRTHAAKQQHTANAHRTGNAFPGGKLTHRREDHHNGKKDAGESKDQVHP